MLLCAHKSIHRSRLRATLRVRGGVARLCKLSALSLKIRVLYGRYPILPRRLSQRDVHNKRPPEGGNVVSPAVEALIVFPAASQLQSSDARPEMDCQPQDNWLGHLWSQRYPRRWRCGDQCERQEELSRGRQSTRDHRSESVRLAVSHAARGHTRSDQ